MKTYILSLSLLALTVTGYGQVSSPSLNQKWNRVMDKAETYQHYKVVKITDINETWRAVQDTIQGLKSQLKEERAVIVHQKEQIGSLQKQVKEVQAKLDEVTKDVESIKFLGMEVNKYSYGNTLWIIIGIVLAGCAVLFFLFNNSNRVTNQKINEYETLFSEFEEYKKNALEKERKLKRDLQTHINKIEEMKTGKSRMV